MTLEYLFSFATLVSFATGYTLAYRGLVVAGGKILKGLSRAGGVFAGQTALRTARPA